MLKMGQTLFITGTGTDIGKTALSLAIILRAQSQGLRVAYFKPIQCGTFVYGTPPATYGDADWIKAFADPSLTVQVTYALRMSASPHLAAEREKISIDLDRIQDDLVALQKNHDLVLVEGAGGSAVPVNRKGDNLTNLASQMSLPCLLASAPDLGTLHHTLTTIAFLKSSAVALLGFVFCHRDQEIPEICADNRATLQAITGVPCLGELDYCPELALGPEAFQSRLVAWPSPTSMAWDSLWK